MTTTLVPIANLSNLGVGVADLQAALTAATEVEHDFVNDGDIFILIDNQSAGVRTATLTSIADPLGRTQSEVIAIPAGEMGMFPFMTPIGFGGGKTKTIFTLDAFATTNVGIYRMRKQGR